MAIGMLLMLAACGAGKPKDDAPNALPQVRVAQVGVDQRAASVTGVGTVALRREAQLGFTSPGRIASISVREGDAVRRGQLLAALDTTAVAADVARIAAERARAAAEYERSAGLLAKGWVTQPRVESARAALGAANAQLSAARFQASAARIVAPGPGTVLARLVEPGQVIAAGTPALIVGDRSSGYILRVPLSDRDAARLTLGAPARVTLAALDDGAITGQVAQIAGRADRMTGTFTIEIGLPADARLRSGQIGSASITARGAASNAIRVPAAAIFAARAGEAFVYVVDPATRLIALRKVTIAEAGDEGIQVTGGLSRGEWVATSRVDRLKAGLRIAPLRSAR
ncbi:efflux RND transporter periplasmic adaptor subunit [Sphingomonas sp. PB4P5]|uniref:efflux RND transporter periplasmic adaptor subunit n=1 Tax=Parasphingomonas puruogangriensis TaxID=3096155 RepID=UPI002FCC49AC